MKFGKRLNEVRKSQKMSQDELAKLVGAHGAVIGRYEREEVKPSIEMATQIAQALKVSLDYLVGSTDLLLDAAIIERVTEVQTLTPEDQQSLFNVMDAFLRDAKAKQAYRK